MATDEHRDLTALSGTDGSKVVQRVRVAGTPYERGALIGQAFAEATARSVAFNRRYLATHQVSRGDLEEILGPYLAASRAAMPHLVEQVRGLADGAEKPFLDLFFANVFEEVYGIIELGRPVGVPLERCTDVVLRSAGSTLLGHNEQWYAGDDGAVGLVLDVSDDGPAVLSPVVAGTLPLIGINELGGAFGTMSLSATDERTGVPRALVARDLLEARDLDDDFNRASRDGRAGGYSYTHAFPSPNTPTTPPTQPWLRSPATRQTGAATDWPALRRLQYPPHPPWTAWSPCSQTTRPRARTSVFIPTLPTVTRGPPFCSRWSVSQRPGRCGWHQAIPALPPSSSSGSTSRTDPGGVSSLCGRFRRPTWLAQPGSGRPTCSSGR